MPAILRMQCHLWWRRQLRRAQARAVEGSAIGLGYVHKGGDCYVSDESVMHRLQQNARNAAMLESTIARNELGQEFTLAELAAKSPANAGIKRAELMTRINGFERIAIDMRHAGVFFTLTAPSRMHRYKTIQGRPVLNRKYDQTKPNEAQAHHTKTWARIRAALARRGVSIYGFRIAEPNHDGTPHWHVLVFCRPEHMAVLKSTVYRYALAVDGDEAGARKHRVDWKPMDPAKGTAAGYIAKYVAKNIDGYKLEKDLHGNDAIETSQRVEAWATRWRIRQFQQIGGPPVTVWRELRRVESVPADAPSFVAQAHNAVNRVAVVEGSSGASVAWNHYVEAQGGVFCGRGYRVRLATVDAEGVSRYGESRAPRVIGITFNEEYKVRDARGNWTDVREMQTIVESKRFEWEIMRPAKSAGIGSRSATASASSGFDATYAARSGARKSESEYFGSVEGLDFGFKADEIGPWTCVNNCTGWAESVGNVDDQRGARRGIEGTRATGAARDGDSFAFRQDGGPKATGAAQQHHRKN
ncbi:replication endonuclease [Caballeronia sp. LZ016]|uniref:replication endonuclease n=1 Tax=Caballeronia sp. LZ016 TaxID=3038554 RepID=UPI0028567F45|nr:replication endonuclease [Caballeronia sp. LZ016]MDR5739502.1 replication endonuclease [Caballeronia sp. LZ016]